MKRWILWNLRCKRGRECANLKLAYPIEEANLPKGAVAVAQYSCGGCGTYYEWRSDTNGREQIADPGGKPSGISIPGKSSRKVPVSLK